MYSIISDAVVICYLSFFTWKASFPVQLDFILVFLNFTVAKVVFFAKRSPRLRKNVIFSFIFVAILQNSTTFAAVNNTKLDMFMKKFELMPLPYADDALEPVISKETISFHHGKHLLAYVNNLNGLLEGSPLAELPLEEIVKKAEGGMLNNAGQILNHELYFRQFQAPKEDNKPTGRILEAIERDFGSFEAFKEEFQKKGATLFGSGWVWLSADADGKLVITQETNAANPVQRGLKPLLTFDVWEHAYYLDYQNRRPDHLAALWQIINWEVVEKRYHQ